MSKPKSIPPIHCSGRRPLDSIDSLHPSSLPPELGSLDMAWDDDPSSVASIDLLQNSDLMDIDADANERTTAIPEIPMDQLVRATMAEAEARESQRGADPTEPLTAGAARPGSSVGSDKGARDAGGSASPPNRAYAMADRRLPQFGLEKTLETGLAEQATLEQESANSAMPVPRSATPSTEPAPRLESRLTSPPTVRRADTGQLRNQMKDCYATGDFSGALEFSEALLKTDPGDLEAQRFVTSCRDVLTQMLLSRIGSLQQHVRVALSADELRWLNLDHRAGFLLSLVDGTLTVEELLDVSGMARLESLRLISALLEQRVLRLYAE